jgi:uncharacterized protein
MVRPRSCRCIQFKHKCNCFKPQGTRLNQIETINLTVEELEALRLKNVKNLNQIDCANKMKTSQSTFQRILSSAYKKISDALINGKAIKIDKQ